jgi:hypothetical protein
MRFHANHISTSIAGDYCQAMFAAEQDAGDSDSPYLVLQPQFDTPDGGEYYIETHDRNYCGHFRLRRVEFTPEKLSIEFDRPMIRSIHLNFWCASLSRGRSQATTSCAAAHSARARKSDNAHYVKRFKALMSKPERAVR